MPRPVSSSAQARCWALRSARCVISLASLFALAPSIAAPTATAGPTLDPLVKPATLTVRANSSVMLALAPAGDRLVAVGERGIILLSDDQGATWRQTASPVSTSLTGVHFVDASRGWAVGHGQVVLHSSDGGVHWLRQLDGLRAAQLELDSAKQQASAQPDKAQALVSMAERLVKEGADKPFLDVYFADANNGLVVGAYGSIFSTSDGGQNWRPRRSDVDNAAARHLYRIHVRGDQRYLSGEQGLLLHASGADAPFVAVKVPYAGTFFGVITSAAGDLLAYGLRGNLWRQSAGSSSWVQVPTPSPTTITSAVALRDGSLIVVDEAGGVLRSSDNGLSFAAVAPTWPSSPLTDVIQSKDGSLILTSGRGPLRISTTGATPANSQASKAAPRSAAAASATP